MRLDFDPSTLATATNPFTVVVADAGQGAASGFAIGGSIPLVAKSWVGADGRAYFDNVYGVPLTPSGGAGGQIAWWVELQ